MIIAQPVSSIQLQLCSGNPDLRVAGFRKIRRQPLEHKGLLFIISRLECSENEGGNQ